MYADEQMRGLIVVFVSGLIGCSPSGAPDAGVDAGIDAGHDAGPTRGLEVGVATVDITPAPGIVITGFGQRASTDVRDPLEAAVLFLRRGSARVAVVTLDLPGIGDWHATQVRARVGSILGLGFEEVIVAASHTHSAPMLGADDAWTEETLSALERAAAQARADAVPARARIGEGAITFDVGRRLVVDGVAEALPNPDGLHDPRVRTLIFEGDAGPVALMSLVVCHPNVLRGVESTRISADFPGEARERLRERFGVPWLVLMGAAGDVRSSLTDDAGEFRQGTDADLEALGAELAFAVETSVETSQALDVSTLRVSREAWRAPLLAGGDRAIELSALRLGSLSLVTIPGEPVVSIGLNIERALLAAGYEHGLIVGYANGYASYIVAPEDFAFGGYEVERSVMTPEASPMLEAALVDAAASLL